MARRAGEGGDDGTNDLIVSDIIRRNEQQVWFVAEHVVNSPLTQARYVPPLDRTVVTSGTRPL